MSRAVFAARATAEDVPALARLAAACSPHPWTARQLAEEVAGIVPGAVLVLKGPDAAGTVVACASCSYRVTADEAEILDVSVLPGWRRQGFARFLVRLALRRARRAGAAAAFLEVRAGNDGAMALYRSVGFFRSGIRREYYREPVEDAVLMARPLRNEEC